LLSLICLVGFINPVLAQTPDIPDWIRSIAWNRNGTKLAYGTQRGMLYILNLEDNSIIKIDNKSTIYSVSWGAQEILATGDADGLVKLWDGHDGKLIRSLTGHTSGVFAVSWDSSGTLLASASRNGYNPNVFIWDIPANKLKDSFVAGDLYSAAWHPISNILGIARPNSIDIQNLKDQSIVELPTPLISASIAWSPDGRLLADGEVATGDDAQILIWDVAKQKVDKTLKGHTGVILSLNWSPDGKRMVSGSHDHTARLWDVETGESIVFYAGVESVWSPVWSPYGGRIALADIPKSETLKLLPNGTSSADSTLRIIVPPQTRQDLKNIISRCVTDTSTAQELQIAVDKKEMTDVIGMVHSETMQAKIGSGCLADISAVANSLAPN